MIPGKDANALSVNLPDSCDRAFNLFFIQSLAPPFLSLVVVLSDVVVVPLVPPSRASIRTPRVIPKAVKIETIVVPCSLKRVLILSPRVPVSLAKECNLKLRIKPENLKIPVIFHNLRGYDSHFIMQQIGEIAKNHAHKDKKGKEQHLEKYMAFMLGNQINFIDSFQFMSSSLDKLISNLPKDDLKYTSKEFTGKKLSLMSQKGVYPYDFMDSFEKFDQMELPTKDQFYSILNDQHITNDEYDHAKKVWKAFNIETMGEYHDLYLKSDVLLLADVFESSRKTCLQYYKLDPCHYFTSPGLSWDAMLKMTNIKLELMIDVNMYQFIEKGMRGRVSYIVLRHSVANNDDAFITLSNSRLMLEIV